MHLAEDPKVNTVLVISIPEVSHLDHFDDYRQAVLRETGDESGWKPRRAAPDPRPEEVSGKVEAGGDRSSLRCRHATRCCRYNGSVSDFIRLLIASIVLAEAGG